MLLFKFLLIGDGNVGKTSLVRRLCQDEFDDKNESTIGVEFFTKLIHDKDTDFKLQIWDTAGQEKYRSIGKTYYRNSVGILIVYDITDHKTFESIEDWISEAEVNCDPNGKKILIGNKSDLVDSREVTTQEAEELARNHSMLFLETSAKNNTNVFEAFMNVSREVYAAVLTNEIILSNCSSLSLQGESEEEESVRKEKKCCK